MDALKFIVEDVGRDEKEFWPRKLAFLLGVFVFPIAIGLSLRADLSGVYDPHTLVPNILAALFLGIVPVFFLFKRRRSPSMLTIFSFSLLLCAGFAMARVFLFYGEPIQYTDSGDFMNQTKACFLKGSFAATVLGFWTALFVFLVASWPSRTWRFFLSLTTAASATVMLGFHCDSSSLAHVMLGHLLPGLIVGSVTFFALEMIFKIQMKKVFPRVDSRKI